MAAHGGTGGRGSSSGVLNALLALRERLADWEIGPDDLVVQLDNPIGFGSTSVVYLGSFKSLPRFVAVKECSISEVEEQYGLHDQQTILAVTRELEIWPEVDHPNILKFLGFAFSEDFSTLRIVSQYCSGGTLFDLLHNCWHIHLSNRQKLKILTDIAGAVDYLHRFKTPVIHRDLKSLNIFLLDPVVDATCEVKPLLADFGFARISKDRAGWSDLTSGVGTPHWMAPEVFQGSEYHTKADVFSFAVIMYEVSCRRMFFETIEAEEVQKFISQGVRPPLVGTFGVDTHVPPDMPDRLRQLIAWCWSQAARERPTMAVVLQELQSLQWPDLVRC